MVWRHKILKTGILMLLLQGNVMADTELEFSSGDRQVMLIELFTSQGCSSCPPADRWLHKFVGSRELWQEVVPVAYHVDYWDYLGWRDVYASNDYSKRQRQHRLLGNISAVYTPGFVVNGQEWRGWFRRKPLPSGKESAGNLSARLRDRHLSVTYTGDVRDSLTLNVAMLGFGIQTEIEAGENGGRNLPYEFVVLGHQQHHADEASWEVKLPELPEIKLRSGNRAGLAVWVSRKSDLSPIQATGTWLPDTYLVSK